tara:strand:- start:4717 stop:5100 length:384 start_codon:yes stop_codon:yes gene_type:complete
MLEILISEKYKKIDIANIWPSIFFHGFKFIKSSIIPTKKSTNKLAKKKLIWEYSEKFTQNTKESNIPIKIAIPPKEGIYKLLSLVSGLIIKLFNLISLITTGIVIKVIIKDVRKIFINLIVSINHPF